MKKRGGWALSTMGALTFGGCGAASLAAQRNSAAVVNPNGIVCVRPEESTDYRGEGQATLQGVTAGGTVRERFSLVDTPRQACLRRAGQQIFRACQEFANGLLTRDQYIRRRDGEEQRCEVSK